MEIGVVYVLSPSLSLALILVFPFFYYYTLNSDQSGLSCKLPSFDAIEGRFLDADATTHVIHRATTYNTYDALFWRRKSPLCMIKLSTPWDKFIATCDRRHRHECHEEKFHTICCTVRI